MLKFNDDFVYTVNGSNYVNTNAVYAKLNSDKRTYTCNVVGKYALEDLKFKKIHAPI